jgi:hypothetical protein
LLILIEDKVFCAQKTLSSIGDFHGKELGEVLSKESDSLKKKYQRRNKYQSHFEKG